MTLLYNQSLTPLPFIPPPRVFVPPSFIDDYLLNNPMHLNGEQGRLIEPILPPPSPADRGRPPLDRRLVLDGILWKIRIAFEG